MGLPNRFTDYLLPMDESLLPRPRTIDWVIGTGLAVIAVGEPFAITMAGPIPSVVAGLIGAVAFTIRRVRPLHAVVGLGLTTTAIEFLAFVTDTPIEGSISEAVAGFTVIFAAGRWGNARTIVVAGLFSLLILPAATNLNPIVSSGVAGTLIEALVVSLALAAGLLLRALADARDQRALAEELQERNRLANDIHDSFAHHMSAIAVRAEAARQLHDPIALEEALLAIKRSASTGLADLRHFVTDLRTPDDNTRPLSGLGDLRTLAGELSNDVLRIETSIDPAPQPMPVTVSNTAYWIAREALTNVLRHATGADEARVQVQADDQHLDLTITDNGATTAGADPHQGHGLISMKTRARAIGGELSAGPSPHGGWLVTARLPFDRGET